MYTTILVLHSIIQEKENEWKHACFLLFLRGGVGVGDGGCGGGGGWKFQQTNQAKNVKQKSIKLDIISCTQGTRTGQFVIRAQIPRDVQQITDISLM